MILKIISEVYIGLAVLVFIISYASWKIKAKIRYSQIIIVFQISGIILHTSFILFSSFYCKPLSFYSEISKIINNLPAALCGLVILVAILCMEIPCTSRIAKKYAVVLSKIYINSMPSQIRQIHKEETNNFISENQAIQKQEILEKKMAFFEKMGRTANIVFKYSLISGIGLAVLNFLLVIGVRKLFLSYSLEKAFICAIEIALWNVIVFSIPVFLVSFGILNTCSMKNLNKPDKLPKINKKTAKKDKTKTKRSTKFAKNRSNKQNIPSEKPETIKIRLGYGLLQLIDEKSDYILTNSVKYFRQKNPEIPEIEIVDCALFKTWEYHIEYRDKDISGSFTGTETYKIMVNTILNSILCDI